MSSDFPNPDSNSADNSSPIQSAEIVEAALVESPGAASPTTASTADQSATELLATIESDELSFLHPTSLLFDLLAHGKTYLVPAAFGLWGAANGDLTLLIISALIFIPAFLTSVFRYFTFRYCIKNDQLIVRQGLIFRSVRTVPISRIQNIDFVQNPIHRMLGVAEVKVETASGTKPEATLRVLSIAQMESLRGSVFEGKPEPEVATNAGSANAGSAMAGSAIAGSANQVAEFESTEVANSLDQRLASSQSAVAGGQRFGETPLLEIPLAWLVKAGLASNRGMIMVGVLLGAYFQFGNGRDSIRFDWFENLWSPDASTGFLVTVAIVGLIAVFFLLRLLGVGWFVLRFYGYRLIRRGDDLRISCGLFTKVSATVPRQRVQFISIHRSWIMRTLGLASIRIETAGGAGKEGENATESVSKRWFIPVIPEHRIGELIKVLRPELDWDETSLSFQPLAAKAGRRLCRLAIVESVLIAGIGLLITRPWGWALGLVMLPLLMMWAVKKSKAMRYARMENGVVYRSGVFNRKTSLTFFEKIQTLRVDQSPFDRRWKMARLTVDTAAAGPADHRIHVPYLDEEFALNELQYLREKTGEEQPVFG